MKKFILDKSNITLFIFYFSLLFISVLSIFLAEYNNKITPTLFLKQIIFIVISIFIIYFMQKLSIFDYEKLSIIVFFVSIILLVLLLIAPESIAPTTNGAKAWFNFKIISIQPSEFAKVSTILIISYLITQDHFKSSNDILKLIQITIITIIPFLLIVKENDFGNALYFIFLFLLLIFLVSNKNKIFLILLSMITLVISSVLIIALYFPKFLILLGMQEYQLKRLLSWINPNEYLYDYSYQITNVLNELKLSGIDGNISTNKTFIPEQYNDFIFSVIAKNFGFIGATIFIIFYLIFILNILKIAKNCQYGNFSYYFLLLSAFTLSYSFILNSYSTTGIIPVIGVSMPFISYGGSSLIANSIIFGIILKINKTIDEERLADNIENNNELY